MFRKTLLAVSVGLVFSMSGCGGGDSDDDPTPQTITTGTGYYIDSAVSGVKTKCGAKSGTTDTDGKFTFEVGKGCTFFLGDMKLRDIDKAILKDGVTIHETDKYTAQILQSLDSDGNPTNGITVSNEFVTALATAKITTLPTNEAETTAMLAVIETAGGTIVTETDAQSHAYSSLISGKALYTIDIDGKNSQDDIGPISFKADGTLTGDDEANTWRFDGDKLYLGTGSAYHKVMSVTKDYILFKDYDGDESTTRAYFERAKAEAFMATLPASNTPPANKSPFQVVNKKLILNSKTKTANVKNNVYYGVYSTAQEPVFINSFEADISLTDSKITGDARAKIAYYQRIESISGAWPKGEIYVAIDHRASGVKSRAYLTVNGVETPISGIHGKPLNIGESYHFKILSQGGNIILTLGSYTASISKSVIASTSDAYISYANFFTGVKNGSVGNFATGSIDNVVLVREKNGAVKTISRDFDDGVVPVPDEDMNNIHN